MKIHFTKGEGVACGNKRAKVLSECRAEVSCANCRRTKVFKTDPDGIEAKAKHADWWHQKAYEAQERARVAEEESRKLAEELRDLRYTMNRQTEELAAAYARGKRDGERLRGLNSVVWGG